MPFLGGLGAAMSPGYPAQVPGWAGRRACGQHMSERKNVRMRGSTCPEAWACRHLTQELPVPERVGSKVLPIPTKSQFLLRERPEALGEEQEPPRMYAGEVSEVTHNTVVSCHSALTVWSDEPFPCRPRRTSVKKASPASRQNYSDRFVILSSGAVMLL